MLNNDILSLNDEQRKAIEYNSGPLLIIAGAGTGKTTVITEKIKQIISKGLAKPEEILALTFTEKASGEMEERVDRAMPYGYFQMFISTFHAFADQILRDEIINIGMNPGYKLLTSAESIIFFRKNIYLFDLKYFRPLGNPNKFIDAFLQHFSRLSDEDITVEKYLEFAKKQEEKEKTVELAQAYNAYQNLKIKEGYCDFSDLIANLLKVFRSRINILKKYQEKFRYVLVDEFQDTNIAQYELIKLLCPTEKNPNLTIVGDDSQAIYKFRGASVSNILTFMKDYPDAEKISLIKNYRSVQSILDSSYRLIKHNDPDTLEAKLGISKKLIAASSNSKKEAVSLFFSKKGEEEADYVAREILKLTSNHQYSDIAILIRANKHANPFIRAFSQYGIPFQFLGPGMLFKKPEIKDLIAYLKILYNLEDSPSFYRVLAMDIFNVDKKDLSFLTLFAKKINQPLYQTTEIYLSFIKPELEKKDFENYRKYLPFLKEETKTKLFEIYKMILRHLDLSHKATVGQILFYFLEDSKYLKKLTTPQSEEEEKKILNITKFFAKLKTYEIEHEDASVSAFVDYLEMCLELGDSPRAEDMENMQNAVNILTVHASKGLEFPVVFLVNLIKGRFPTYEKKETIPIPQDLIKEILPEGDYHLEEERRLFYVGMTRAKKQVYFTAANLYGEEKREKKISPFVIETLGEKIVEKFVNLKKEEKRQLTIFDFRPLDKEENKIVQSKDKENLNLNYFSFSQIQLFETCPLQYKYQYILKIPTSPQSAATFGDSIHKTLQKFYQEYLIQKDLDLNRLYEIYNECWIPLGYASKDHQNRMRKTGEELLKKYYDKFHSKNLKVIDLEKFFKIKVDDYFITGKIDRVDSREGKEIEIIDYKTGKKPDEKDLKKSLQLSIYALAATDSGLYKKELQDVTLTFYYLQDMDKISMKRTAVEMENLRENLKITINEIKNQQFTSKIGPWCSWCQFKILCEAWQ